MAGLGCSKKDLTHFLQWTEPLENLAPGPTVLLGNHLISYGLKVEQGEPTKHEVGGLHPHSPL